MHRVYDIHVRISLSVYSIEDSSYTLPVVSVIPLMFARDIRSSSAVHVFILYDSM